MIRYQILQWYTVEYYRACICLLFLTFIMAISSNIDMSFFEANAKILSEPNIRLQFTLDLQIAKNKKTWFKS